MGKTSKTLQVKFTISDYYSKKILNELYQWFPPDYKILFINKNTSLHIFTQWTSFIAYFYIDHKNTIIVKLTTNWNESDKNVLINSIKIVYGWEYIPDSNLCCGIFRKKDEFKFQM